MNDALRRAMIAAGVDPDKVAIEAKTIDLGAPRKGDRQPGPVTTLMEAQDEQLGIEGIGPSLGIVTIRPGTKRHESLAQLRGTSLEENQVEFLQEFKAADLVMPKAGGWTTSPRGEVCLGMLDHGAIARAEKGKPVQSERVPKLDGAASRQERDAVVVPESTPKARTSDPPTSHEAAEAARMTAQSAKAALLLAHYDQATAGVFGLTDEQAALAAGLSLQSEYATRCSELRKLEPPLLTETGEERVGSAGVARMVSVISPDGVLYVRERGWR